LDDERIARILEDLRSVRAVEVWAEFLQTCSPAILKVIQSFQRDADSIADCYLYVCEQLCRDKFRRLRRFRPDGPASFSTWLQVVVHNLCLDWRRHKYGRERPFESVAQLPPLAQDVFRCLFEEGLSVGEAFVSLQPRYPQLTFQQVEESRGELFRALKPRQRFLLTLRQLVAGTFDAPADALGETAPEQVADGQPDPEKIVMFEEQRASLARSVARLGDFERLLIRLRFEHGLTLQQVAKAAGLPDAQTADRRVKAVLSRLRKELS
jgi:RNA polymerase sigma factor (sigma-70 family)